MLQIIIQWIMIRTISMEIKLLVFNIPNYENSLVLQKKKISLKLSFSKIKLKFKQ